MTSLHRLLPALCAMLLLGCTELPVEPPVDDEMEEPDGLVFDYGLMFTGPFEIYTPEVPGTFEFDDGTTQGWTLMQLYKSTGGPVPSNRIGSWYPGFPAFVYNTPFTLSNSQNLSLKAETSLIVVSDPGRVDIYFQSPDLSGSSDWQGIQGFELDVMRSYYTYCGDWTGFQAQLQVVVIERATGAQKVFAEYPWAFHSLNYYTNHHLSLRQGVFADSRYTVQHLRIRLSMPWPASPECGTRGAYYIGNVAPIR